MSEKPEEDFDEDPEEGDGGESGLDVDQLMRDLDTRKRRSVRASSEPAWRRLERALEERRTAGLLSDFEDYDVGNTDDGTSHKRPARPRRR